MPPGYLIVWGGAWEFESLTSTQGMLMLLAQGPYFGNQNYKLQARVSSMLTNESFTETTQNKEK